MGVPPVLNRQDACSTITIKIVSYLIRDPYIFLSEIMKEAAAELELEKIDV